MSGIPTRPLGRTGYDVSIFALGGVLYNRCEDAEAAALLNRALDLGVNYIDTACTYTDSERKIGLVLPERREQVYLATKTMVRDRDSAAKQLDESFRRLRTDCIDCVQIHDLRTEEELAQITGPDGALKAVEQLKRDGAVRFVGVTGHANPEILAKALEEYPFDTLLTSLGAMHAAVRPFYETVMPVARRRGVGVLGMKVMAYAFLKDYAAEALRFVMSLSGVSAAVVGVDNIEQLEQNVAVARDFEPLGRDRGERLLDAAREIYSRRASEAWFIINE